MFTCVYSRLIISWCFFLLFEVALHINVTNCVQDGLTPLHCAARSGHDLVVDMLMERGAPVSAKTKNGLTALHMATQGDHVDCARILIFHKAPLEDVTVVCISHHFETFYRICYLYVISLPLHLWITSIFIMKLHSCVACYLVICTWLCCRIT